MKTILSGPFFAESDDWLDVISLDGTGLTTIEVKGPKIIVGLSITHPDEKAFPPAASVFPAIVDTGCNRPLEIDERHLLSWNGTNKLYFDLIDRRNWPARSYDIRKANIWLHPEPYTGPRFKGPRLPIHLKASDEIRVMDGSTIHPAPRLPLLGLQALTDNKLFLKVDGTASAFEIAK